MPFDHGQNLPTTTVTAARTGSGYGCYLEGLRGLAALYVVLHHAALQAYDASYDSENLSVWATWWLTLCNRGDLAVAVFIVLSGYCLMLPVAASGQLRDGVLGYLRRRAQRILPAYYAVIALVLACVWWVPALHEPDGTRWDLALPALDRGVILSHLLLVHNFDAEWIWKLNGPLWSVAVEAQLYCVFPLLIALFRRVGASLGALCGIALGYLATGAVLMLDTALAVRTCPWYLGLFAIGMALAVHAQRTQSPEAHASASKQRRWLVLCACVLVCAALAHAALAPRELLPSLIVDPLIALALGCVLLHCSTSRTGRLRAWLETPALLRLGSFSYSLYLLHDPLLSFLQRIMLAFQLSAETRLWTSVFLGVPLVTACAYGLYLLVERPFLPKRPRLTSSVSA